ncbi:MAG: hypothetical protein GWO24_30130, partial [Akkermansiaceae bacterium]|nr:hypothetical protein [Akkermansiaceae bacterium]NIT75786.1 hypothetical protein [Thermoplasmata archaeon]NIY02157.1 hypothetical protein [Thermoplasmata archaeon]
AVIAEGLKSRNELDQSRGKGLGGGDRDTISFTADPETAQAIEVAMREAREVARGDITVENMLAEAERDGFTENLMKYWDRDWKQGDPLPEGVQNLLEG